jgi:hypothetical protein
LPGESINIEINHRIYGAFRIFSRSAHFVTARARALAPTPR